MPLENHILTITEPSIELDKLKFESYDEGEKEGAPKTSKTYGGDVPMIVINKYTFMDNDIQSMTVDCTDIIPTISLSLFDSKSQFAADTYPRDGDVISLRIAARQQDTYRDIRIDFDIDMVNGPNKSAVEHSVGGAKYTIHGTMKVPGLYAEDCKSYGTKTSLEHIEDIANDLKLGLATNIDSTDDSMNLVVAYQSIKEVLDNLVLHSYVSEDSFQKYCIDPYYYVNYVDINRLLDSEEDTDEAFANLILEMNEKEDNVLTEDVNKAQGPLILSSHNRFEGTNVHITKYVLRHSSGSKVKENGYKRILQYFEDDSDEKLVTFDIEPLSSKNMKDIEEPMKARRGAEGEEVYKKQVKYKYVGRKDSDPDTANTHLNYSFAAIHNKQNLFEMEKLKLEIELGTFNPSLHRFQKIPIIIISHGMMRVNADSVLKKRKTEQGFDTMGAEFDPEDKIADTSTIDEFLSGYYVIDGIQYIYKSSNKRITQKLTLLRREWPSRINNINEETTT